MPDSEHYKYNFDIVSVEDNKRKVLLLWKQRLIQYRNVNG